MMAASSENPDAAGSTNHSRARNLVIFHFFEKDATYIRNLAHFLLFGYSTECDYVIVVAGPHTIELPARSNVGYLFTENKNNDFGGYCAAIEALGDSVAAYDTVFFVNSSVRGPFLAPAVTQNWQQVFERKLNGDVGLVGSTINILSNRSPFTGRYKAKYGGREPYSHVQTMAYALSKEALGYLREIGFYSNRAQLTKDEVIVEYELGLSQFLLKKGWNISALLPEYALIDYREAHSEINPVASMGDMSWASGYFGRSAHPFEVLFVKTNRGIFPEAYLDRLAYSMLCQKRPGVAWINGAIIADYVAKIESIPTLTELVPTSTGEYSPDHIVRLIHALLATYPESHDIVRRMLDAVTRK
jgi:hypothetical protein